MSFVLAAVSVPVAFVAGSYAAVQPYAQYVLDPSDESVIERTGADVGIVLGAGVNREGRPYRELQSRLDTAATALERGYVNKLVLSGDNRFPEYNEPTAMKRYLVEERGIDARSLQEDFAGRSTYESCERAAKVFRLERAVIISAGSHLPRAIYLCRHFGVEAYGIAAQAEADNSTRREAMARVKALLNVHIIGENTLLGEPIKLD